MLNTIRKITGQRPHIVAGVVVVIFLAVTVRLLSPGIRTAHSAHNSLLVMETRYTAEEKSANNISSQRAAYDQAFQEFRFYAQNLAGNIDTGQTIQNISQYAKNNNAQVVSIKPGAIVAGVYQKHLLGLPFAIELKGSFPDVLAAMRQMENDSNPGEFRSVKIANNKTGNDVVADLILILYSTNEPMVTNYVTAPSGTVDPFQPLKQPASQDGGNLPLVNQLLSKGGAANHQ